MSQVIEKPMVGKTYHHDAYGVYEYGVYEQGSVLEGREKRTRLGGPFDTLEEAKAEFPDATWHGDGSHFADPDPGPLAPDWFDPLAAGESWDEP